MAIGNIFKIIGLCTIFSSCNTIFVVPHRVKRDLQCYDGKPIEPGKQINLNGYYTRTGGLLPSGDTIYLNYFFFKDGIFISRIEYGRDHKRNLEEYIKKVLEHNEKREEGVNYGSYKISNDTIMTQFFYFAAAGTKGGGQLWFKVSGPEQIKSIYAQNLGEGKYNKGGPIKEKNQAILTFIQTSIPTDANSWFKEKKWFWCKEAWDNRIPNSKN